MIEKKTLLLQHSMSAVSHLGKLRRLFHSKVALFNIRHLKTSQELQILSSNTLY